jgi:hypothetical protein
VAGFDGVSARPLRHLEINDSRGVLKAPHLISDGVVDSQNLANLMPMIS